MLQIIADNEKPQEQHVWIRGNQDSPGEPAPPHFLSILSPAEPKRFDKGKERLELAEAIASPSNPLTARVIVNRVWQHHFGNGIVRTPSNFGQGEPPRIPNCSTISPPGSSRKAGRSRNCIAKSCCRRSMRRARNRRRELCAKTPKIACSGATIAAVWTPKSSRDSLLFVSGNIDLKAGGPAAKLDLDNHRRTVYGFISRRKLTLSLALRLSDAQRHQRTARKTNVPVQRLFFMNSPFVLAESKTLTARMRPMRQATTSAHGQSTAMLLQRRPTPEKRLAQQFLAKTPTTGPNTRKS